MPSHRHTVVSSSLDPNTDSARLHAGRIATRRLRVSRLGRAQRDRSPRRPATRPRVAHATPLASAARARVEPAGEPDG